MDEPELWRPRGTEVPASRQEAELARSPLHTVAGLLAGWNLQLFVGRYLCPVRVADFWHSLVPIPETAPVAPDPDPLALTYRGTATLMPSL